ncbi:MAG: threonine--tRNA ligase [Chloroflexia bacterium]|nr:threonine--tRNA ligase [Chloroflexia bacterium]
MSEKKEQELLPLRHSTAHVMAQAVGELFPEAKFGIGPAIEDGFYYDFELPRPLTPEDLEEIEAHMRRIIREDHAFERRVISPDESEALFAGQDYKLELIRDLLAGRVDEDGEALEQAPAELSVYRHDTFMDLCRGPHLESTGRIPAEAFKLLRIAGAYWRGDERRPQLQRIYGTVWPSQEELEDYIQRLEEMERRDHRRLGRDLDLFSTDSRLGAGLVLWHPKGAMVRYLIEEFWRQEHLKWGYELLFTPHIGRAELWETSGHLDHYKDAMYAPLEIDEQEYYLKPMNCPFHILVYNSQLRSYRDLPLRWAELGTVYRYERSGTLHGLLRVRGFTQDDAHIICRPDQIEDEILRCLDFTLHILSSFGFEAYDIALSVRDPQNKAKYFGRDENWAQAERSLVAALEARELDYRREEGEAVFYGPKIDLKIKDALGRSWQCTTIQFDFNIPERFDMSFIGDDGQEHRPYMVHRALLGSLERFFGVLIEHYVGAFPVWLAPVQVALIPITDEQVDYGHDVANKIKAAGLRVVVDESNRRMQAKIREHQLQKVPYMLILGRREAAAGQVSVRLRSEEDLGAMPLEQFLELAQEDIAARR